MSQTGQGSLPDKCPNCGAEAPAQGIYEWSGFDYESESRDAVCTKCNTKFFETYEVTSWEKL